MSPAPEPAPSRFSALRGWLVVGVVLAAWVFWLRGPSFDAPLWNADEAVHRVVAGVILDGGHLYRDVVDHRGPVSYYAAAALFKFTGLSLPALRIAVSLAILACALLLGRVARRHAGNLAGAVTALTLIGLSCGFLIPEDMFAAHTEWLVMLFTSLAAWLFWFRGPATHAPGRAALAGVCVGLAAMTKQSALLEIGPGLAAIALAAVAPGGNWRRPLLTGLALLGAFAGTMLAIGAWCVHTAGWEDFWYQFWTYNMSVYGPEIAYPDRILSALPWIARMAAIYPVLLLAIVAAFVTAGLGMVQWRPLSDDPALRPRLAYLFTWTLLSLGSAMSGGRGFSHYLIVSFPAFAWLVGWSTARVVGWLRARPRWPRLGTATAWLAGAAVVAPLLWIPPQDRGTQQINTAYGDEGMTLVQALSAPTDPIFVWGFSPETYAFADRPPASRYVYCTFPTGLVPWTNTDPEIDTSYAVVPGSLDKLVADLRRTQPKVVVDYAITPDRRFGKYPIAHFPALHDFIAPHYLEVDSPRFSPHAFRVMTRADWTGADDEALPSLSGGVDLTATLEGGSLQPGLNHIRVRAYVPNGTVRGLGLHVPGRGVVRVEIPLPRDVHEILVPVPAPDADSTLEFAPLYLAADGEWQEGALQSVAAGTAADAQRQTDFAVPVVTQWQPLESYRFQNGGYLSLGPGQRAFAVHAPGILRYALPAGAREVHGEYLLADGAYADSNASPTDGAEFIVRLILPDGTASVLHQRVIDPRNRPEDRGALPFAADLPADLPTGTELELEITTGPHDNAASDWTFWRNIVIQTSP